MTKAVKKIAVGAAVVGAMAAGAGKFIDISSQSKGSLNSPDTQTIITSQGLILPSLTSDPANPVAGQMWYRSDAGVTAHFDAVQNRVVYSSEINNGMINVTSKGIINGLSVLPNDGTGGFGPDTTLGATAPGQYGGTYTVTTGVNETVNYIISAGGGHIIVGAGNYNIGGQFSSDANALISIPAIATGLHITIEGEYTPMTDENGGNISGVNFLPTTAAPSSASSFTYPLTPAIFGVAPQPNSVFTTENNPVVLTIKNVGFNMPDNPTLSCINASYAYGLDIDGIVINNANGSTAEVTNLNAVGVLFPYQTNNGYVRCGIITISSMYVGVYMGPHTYIEKIYVSFCQVAITGNVGIHGALVLNADLGSCPYFVGGSGFGLRNDYSGHADTAGVGGTGLMIVSLKLSIADSGFWYSLIWAIYTYNSTSPRITILTLSLVNNAGISLNNFMTYVPAVAAANLKIVNSYRQGAAISTNPPVSATAYQNTNPYDIEIDLPVYATTAGTAGYVTVAKGSTSTPTAIGNQFVNGSTSSTSVDIIRLRVPAGWYYEFTASGVTFGTASVFAD